MAGLLLLGEGAFYFEVADGLRTVEPAANGAWPDAEFVAAARDAMPAAYLVSGEGLVFGLVALVGAIGIFTRKRWGSRLVLVASVPLALVAIAASFLMPREWDMQAVFLGLCVVLWWGTRKRGPP